MKLQLDNYYLDYIATKGVGPCIVFCTGFNSNKEGNKAIAIEAFCKARGQAFIRFDYSGHGKSGGDFSEGCISQWLKDTLVIVDELTTDGVIMIGSSMGGWISLLASLARPRKVRALLLLACAADMTKYYPEILTDVPAKTDSCGRLYFSVPNEYDDQSPYSIYQHLIDDGANHHLLDASINLTIPVRLIHGVQDEVIPWQRSQEVLEKIQSSDVRLDLIKTGDHRLSSEHDLSHTLTVLESLLPHANPGCLD
jgi:pimeloyl-ACP methyl ester carboxylesterase